MLEKLRSKIILKIGLLIIIETIFIFSNFGILAYFQSEDSSLGNSINIAGKNRYLTASLLLQVEKYLDSSSSNIPQVKAAMDKLESNIQTLKQGGKISDIELKPLPSEFSGSWDIINKKWQSFNAFINNKIINSSSSSSKQSSLTTTMTIGQSSSAVKKTQLESMAAGLIDSSDILVTKLGQGAKQNSQNLILLELVLGIINIGILVLILYLVIKILRPIFALTAATSKIKKGNFDVSVELPKGSSNDELSILSESFNSMLSSIRDYIKYQNELKNEIQKANEELKNKNRLMDEFVNIAAHELRTPIQPIIGLTEVVYSKTKDTEQRQLLDAIARNAKRLQRLTERMLDVARIESQTLKLNKERFNINEKIRNVVNDIIKSKEDETEITFVKPQIDPIIVEADKIRIYEVISNLLTNAIKFTKKKGASTNIGGGNDINNTITISTTTVKSNQRENNKDDDDNNKVIISIKDMGTGIDSDIHNRLFTKFATKSDTGSGLGLFISKNIIEAHGGKIWAEKNADGRGATFSFTLPIEAK
jgi:signal transduction histidine kinase